MTRPKMSAGLGRHNPNQMSLMFGDTGLTRSSLQEVMRPNRPVSHRPTKSPSIQPENGARDIKHAVGTCAAALGQFVQSSICRRTRADSRPGVGTSFRSNSTLAVMSPFPHRPRRVRDADRRPAMIDARQVDFPGDRPACFQCHGRGHESRRIRHPLCSGANPAFVSTASNPSVSKPICQSVLAVHGGPPSPVRSKPSKDRGNDLM